MKLNKKAVERRLSKISSKHGEMKMNAGEKRDAETPAHAFVTRSGPLALYWDSPQDEASNSRKVDKNRERVEQYKKDHPQPKPKTDKLSRQKHLRDRINFHKYQVDQIKKNSDWDYRKPHNDKDSHSRGVGATNLMRKEEAVLRRLKAQIEGGGF
jgi:hypothetical protein